MMFIAYLTGFVWRTGDSRIVSASGSWQGSLLVARMVDGPAKYWNGDRNNISSGGQGRPMLRWSDSLESFAGGDWMSLAVDRAKWSILTPGFVSYES